MTEQPSEFAKIADSVYHKIRHTEMDQDNQEAANMLLRVMRLYQSTKTEENFENARFNNGKKIDDLLVDT